ncbi:glycoside hydrolase family 47 protein [Aplosporella prunicola CBS 121167]|uniref:alpha-1,2-Mannosidase n=1 Tax=Aplosporella prunicola CBS 121167 TaxID=1176127 RepID=A0A6A6B3U8_9PEZI|nr:glycoside hydrolase family 47 protein [Aplosporella prunicola CBS 121167]KAF2138043.1 glycoside hydrolase family 47 protein [Aplosporella prunicola CBS 121167]
MDEWKPKPRSRRMAAFRRNPTPTFKLLAAVLIITFYLLYVSIYGVASPVDETSHDLIGPVIQHRPWTGPSGRADEAKTKKVAEAMKYTFAKYKQRAWGYDDILPVSGGKHNSRNGWGAFIVDSASTLALMGLWDEFMLSLDHIIDIDFSTAEGLVDPFETTIRYVGGIVSLIDLIDAGVVPPKLVTGEQRLALLSQATILANKLAPAYDSPTGMPYPRVNFKKDIGQGDPPELYEKYPDKVRYENPSIGPARAGSNLLEYRTLTRLNGIEDYFANASLSWAPLVWDKYIQKPPGLISAPIDITTGAPVGRQRHWDAGHDSYYEYLIKAAILAPKDRYSKAYEERWLQAVDALRHSLATRSSYADNYNPQHLFIGKLDGEWYLNEQSHLACFAPGNLMLGASYLAKPALIKTAQALLEACHHTYASTSTGIGPELWSWEPMSNLPPGTFSPQSPRQRLELAHHGFWVVDPSFRLRPEYVESLFYAWRITGQKRYRDWAWDAFLAMEKHCKTDFGYAALQDVMAGGEGKRRVKHLDESESFWAAETLKYIFLTLTDVNVGSLDEWVFSTEGHPFRMIR